MSKEIFEKTAKSFAADIGNPIGSREPVSGRIGIELEAEGDIGIVASNFWYTENDGSLRNGGKEYILKNPIDESLVDSALEDFISRSKNFTFAPSPRTSCHVHWNIQDYTLREIYTIIGVYWMFEDILVSYCGPTRIGNLFCLRATDAKHIVSSVLESLRGRLPYIYSFSVDTHKYAALNLASIAKIGSIEFRSMRGIYKKKEIKTWVNILEYMIKAAKSINDPVKVYDLFKELTPEQLVEKFFGPYEPIIREVPHWKSMLKTSSFFLGQLANTFQRAEKEEFGKYSAVKKKMRFTSDWPPGTLTSINLSGLNTLSTQNLYTPVSPTLSTILTDEGLQPPEGEIVNVHTTSVVPQSLMSANFGEY